MDNNDIKYVAAKLTQKSEYELVYTPIPAKETVDQLLSEVSNLHPVCAAILVQRNLDSYSKLKDFFNPNLAFINSMSPLADMDKAAGRLAKAIENRERIMLYGDYDVDGTCAVAVMYNVLHAIGADLIRYQPDRYGEGYGVSEKGVRLAAHEGATLLITLDCGILAHDKITLANELGVDVIVCDHHLPGNELPSAHAVLNPKRSDCAHEGKELCGCGVAYMLLRSLSDMLGFEETLLLEQLPLVAIATCCDIVPLTGVNRLLVAEGLKMLNSDMPEGIRFMMRMAGYAGELDVSDVVFKIGPRINAAGRLDHASIAVDLLTTENEDIIEARAADLEKLNTQRRLLDKQTTAEALEQMLTSDPLLEKNSTVVYHDKWHKGVVGIIASRLTETCYRPTVVLTGSNGILTGSARSVDGFNLHAAIAACSDTLVQFGGHDAAAGLTLRQEKLAEFTLLFENAAGNLLAGNSKLPSQKVDMVVALSDWYNTGWISFYRQLCRLKPYGPGNREPVFESRGCKARNVQVVGGEHLKFQVYHPEHSADCLDVIAFRQAAKYDALADNKSFSLVYVIKEAEWQGRKNIQLEGKAIIVDY
jgi:single-stranded-DNA-specific exonuclease